MKTTLDILNMCCQGEQKLKGGINVNQKWISQDELKKANKIIETICEQCLEEKCCEGGNCYITDLKITLGKQELTVTEEVVKE
jgi:hypothetical protein